MTSPRIAGRLAQSIACSRRSLLQNSLRHGRDEARPPKCPLRRLLPPAQRDAPWSPAGLPCQDLFGISLKPDQDRWRRPLHRDVLIVGEIRLKTAGAKASHQPSLWTMTQRAQTRSLPAWIADGHDNGIPDELAQTLDITTAIALFFGAGFLEGRSDLTLAAEIGPRRKGLQRRRRCLTDFSASIRDAAR